MFIARNRGSYGCCQSDQVVCIYFSISNNRFVSLFILVHSVRKKIERKRKWKIIERERERKKKLVYYCGKMNEMAVDLVLIKKQMVCSNQMIKKAVFEEVFEWTQFDCVHLFVLILKFGLESVGLFENAWREVDIFLIYWRINQECVLALSRNLGRVYKSKPYRLRECGV